MPLYDVYKAKFPALIEALENARRRNRMSHAFLLQSDSERVREEFSRVLAQIAGCPESRDGKPCLHCDFCRLIEANAYPEYHTLSPVGKMYQIQVGEVGNPEPNTVRYFTDRFYFTSVDGAERKIGVIFDADRMGVEAQNALLKTLEEPPPQTLIVLATGNAASLLPTTRSRCQNLMLLANQTEFDFSGRDELLRLLTLLATGGGDFRTAERCAAGIIALAAGLRDDAENRVEMEYESRIAEAKEFDDRLVKRLEKQRESASSGAYMKERGEFLAAIHCFFAQRYLLAAGAGRQDLANPEFVCADALPPQDTAQKQLEAAEELLNNLRFNVNEALALRNFVFTAASFEQPTPTHG